jgi:hypothetical protein
MAKELKIARDLGELPVDRRHPAVMADITGSTQTDQAVGIIGAERPRFSRPPSH